MVIPLYKAQITELLKYPIWNNGEYPVVIPLYKAQITELLKYPIWNNDMCLMVIVRTSAEFKNKLMGVMVYF
jgi:hypothetical protein